MPSTIRCLLRKIYCKCYQPPFHFFSFSVSHSSFVISSHLISSFIPCPILFFISTFYFPLNMSFVLLLSNFSKTSTFAVFFYSSKSTSTPPTTHPPSTYPYPLKLFFCSREIKQILSITGPQCPIPQHSHRKRTRMRGSKRKSKSCRLELKCLIEGVNGVSLEGGFRETGGSFHLFSPFRYSDLIWGGGWRVEEFVYLIFFSVLEEKK